MTARAYADWGDPRPAEWLGPREPLGVRLPPDLIREIRERSRTEGTSVSVMVQRLLETGLGHRPVASGAAHADLVSTLFD
jgi:hypothetical protein